MSVASDVSLATRPIDCPVCERQLAARSVFLHLKTKHTGYFQQQTTKLWLQEANQGKPLKIFWNKKNDFDEEETIVLFGCLSSGKTFNLEHKAILHFKKNPSDLKEHNRLVTELLNNRNTELEKTRKEKEEKAFIPEKSQYMQMKKDNDPELCGALMDVIKNHLDICERLSEDVKKHLDMSSKVFNPNAAGSQKLHTVYEFLEMLEKVRDAIKKKPTQYKILSNILGYLWHFLHLRKFFNGYSAPELKYPWFNSRDHPEGELSYGTSKFAKYIWPWDTPMNPIDNSISHIEV